MADSECQLSKLMSRDGLRKNSRSKVERLFVRSVVLAGWAIEATGDGNLIAAGFKWIV